jgi:hypothetical protein
MTENLCNFTATQHMMCIRASALYTVELPRGSLYIAFRQMSHLNCHDGLDNYINNAYNSEATIEYCTSFELITRPTMRDACILQSQHYAIE